VADTIDVHAHVFNLRYLPLAGIIAGRLPGPAIIRRSIGRAIAKVLNSMTGDGSALEAVSPRRVQAMVATGAAVDSSDAIIMALAAAAPPELLNDEEVREGVEAAAASGGAPPAPMAAMAGADAAALGFSTLFSKLRDVDVRGLFDTIGDFLRWISFLTQDEATIVKRLLDTYPVDLYVHHMMDMQHYYDPGSTFYRFDTEQIRRTRQLVERFSGRLVTFVAWSPKRENDAELIERTVTSGGAIGVKVYPPSGYTADEAMNDPLWRLCLDRDIPVFTHCTPGGFEAKRGFGLKSDPKFWRAVLERPGHERLRLCLGHAGGSEGWFASTEEEWNTSFAKKVFDLCVDFPNVYCETGFLDEIFNGTMAQRFIARVARCIEERPEFARKLMYGTDWHMIARLDNHKSYFDTFREAFDDARLRAHAQLFFYGNAVRYLNIPGFLARHQEGRTFDVEAVQPHLLAVEAKAQAIDAAAPR
jgi:predicted TIM-barrel fold metal-dependent hydrolase